MQSTAFEIYKVIDPSLKNAEWMDNCVSLLRRDWRPIINPLANAENKNWLFSRQDMSITKAMFKADSNFMKSRGKQMIPLPILENIKNLLVEEIRKAPPKAELTADDPASVRLKKSDLFKLKNRAKLENDVNQNRAAIGKPKFKMPYDKFKTNVEEFDDMGLNDQDPDDVNFWAGAYQTLNFQIAGQNLINKIIKIQRFDEDTIEDFVIDILSDLIICMQIYVDKITGEMKYDYIYPETFYGIFGKKSDGTDDICNGYQKSVTVQEWLNKVGNEFDWEKDWTRLLWAINYRNGTQYTGFRINNATFDSFTGNANVNTVTDQPNNQSVILEWTLAYTYEVYMGYIEFPSPEATTTYMGKKGKNGRVKMSTATSIPPDYNVTPEQEAQGYQKESKYQQQHYCANFIATSAVSQWIYGWGKVYHQTLHGANDEYSNGTLWYYRKRGRSAVEISIPYLQLANDAFYKMLWAVYEAHPDWEVYQVEEMTELAKIMYSQAGAITGGANPNEVAGSLKKLIEYFRENLVRIKAIPRVDGKPMPNMNNTPTTEHRGMDPIAIAMQSVETWAEAQVMEKIGLSDLRRAQANQPREGFKLNEAETQFSLNMTGYIYRMIQYMKERVATSTLTTAQVICKYKDTIPYNWLKELIGDENFMNLQTIDDFAAHRLGILVQDRNTQVDKQRIMDAANLALDKGDGRGGLSFGHWFIITQTDDFKQAAKTLDFLDRKEKKKKRAEELQNMQIANRHAQQMQEGLAKANAMQADLLLRNIQEQNKGAETVANIGKEAKENVKQMTVDNEAEKQGQKAEGEKQILQEKSNLENQKPFANS